MRNEEQSPSLDAKILAEFERLVVLEGREKAERLTCNLYGRVALGTSGRTRAAIHEIVRASKVTKPKKTKVETKAEAKSQAETITELPSEAFNAEGIWEPKETNELQYNLLVSALETLDKVHDNPEGCSIDREVASNILAAILKGDPHPNLPATMVVDLHGPATVVTYEAPETEALPVPALIKLEAEVTRAWERVRESHWQWAVALCAIHDSKLYPDSASAGSWERYTEGRWGLGRAQSFNLVAWVHHEITLDVAYPNLLPIEEGGQSTPVDSGASVDTQSTPVDSETPEPKAPERPIHATEKASRKARVKPRKKVGGKLNEDDLADLVDEALVVPIEGTKDYMSRTEADRLVAEGTLAKVDGKYYPPKAKPAPKPATKSTPPSHDSKKIADFDMSELGDPNDWGTLGSTLVKLHLTEMEFKVLNKGLNPATPDAEVAICGHKLLLSYRKRYTAINPAGFG